MSTNAVLRPGTYLADPNAPSHALAPNANGSLSVQNVSGAAISVNTEGLKASYAMAIQGLVASSGTPVVQLQGSATKTVRITKIVATAYGTTGTGASVVYLVRTTATATGSSASPSIVAMDSANATATATPLQFASGTVNSGTTFEVNVFPQASSSVVVTPYLWLPAPNTQEFVLRGTSQFLNIQFSIGSATGAYVDVTVYWTEE